MSRSWIINGVRAYTRNLFMTGSCGHCGEFTHAAHECPTKQRCDDCGAWMVERKPCTDYVCPRCLDMYHLSSDGLLHQGKFYVPAIKLPKGA